MLVLYETSAGYSLFKVNDQKKYSSLSADDIYDGMFQDSTKAKESLELLSFQPFVDTADAVSAITACQEGRVSSSLQQFLLKKMKKLVKKSSDYTSIAVADKALAVNIKQDVLSSLSSSNTKSDTKMKVVHDDKTSEIFRGIRCYLDDWLSNDENDNNVNISSSDIHKMQLGLSHSLGRYKLKFSADKVDTMIIQAVGLLDELDKEINTYAMRVKEWYGWHFPELQAIASDNATYAKIVLAAGHRYKLKDADLTSIYNVDNDEGAMIEINAVKEAAEISMGTDITDQDVMNIQSLAEQVISMTEYRAQLFEYLRNRMHAIAPNLTILTGELVGARLIAHAGSLINLAKQPASTVQILGAEKALFRALKTKHDTPKYGLIYHASLIGQAAPKHKGKISRVLAAKASLAIRVDALSDDVSGSDEIDTTVGYEGRAKVEARLRQLDGNTHMVNTAVAKNGANLKAQKTAMYDPVIAKTGSANVAYNAASDMVKIEVVDTNGDNNGDNENTKKKEKKAKKDKKRKNDDKGEITNDVKPDPDVTTSTITPAEDDVATSPAPPKKKHKHDKKSKDEKDDDDENDDEKKSAKKAAKKAKKEKRKSQE